MIIVTFEELLHFGNTQRWVESSRIFENKDEAIDFIEFLYDDGDYNGLRNFKVWNATKAKIIVSTKVKFEE